MGREDGRSFGIKPVIEFVRRKLGRANPVGASVLGPDLTKDEQRRLLYSRSSRLYTKADSDDARSITPEQKIPFGNIDEHRRRRGLR